MNETTKTIREDPSTLVPPEFSKTTAHLFASSPTAPRRRRASDVIRLVVATAAFGLLGWAASNAPPIDARVTGFFAELPNWLSTLGWIGYSLAGVVAVGMVVVVVGWGGVGRGVLRDLIAAALLVVLAGLIAARLVTESWPEFLPEFIERTDQPSYPTLRTAFVVVVAAVLATYVTFPVQRLLRWMVIVAVVSPFILGLTTFTALCGALALGTSSVAAVRWVFGSPEG